MSDDSSNRTDVSTIHLDNISLQNRENVDTNSKFIGFDLSTQQVSNMAIKSNNNNYNYIEIYFRRVKLLTMHSHNINQSP